MSTIVERKKQPYRLVASERTKIALSTTAVAISLVPKPIGLTIPDEGETPLELALSDCEKARERAIKYLNIRTGAEALIGVVAPASAVVVATALSADYTVEYSCI